MEAGDEQKIKQVKPERPLERPDSPSERLTRPGSDAEFEIDPADFFDPEEFGYRRRPTSNDPP